MKVIILTDSKEIVNDNKRNMIKLNKNDETCNSNVFCWTYFSSVQKYPCTKCTNKLPLTHAFFDPLQILQEPA